MSSREGRAPLPRWWPPAAAATGNPPESIMSICGGTEYHTQTGEGEQTLTVSGIGSSRGSGSREEEVFFGALAGGGGRRRQQQCEIFLAFLLLVHHYHRFVVLLLLLSCALR